MNGWSTHAPIPLATIKKQVIQVTGKRSLFFLPNFWAIDNRQQQIPASFNGYLIILGQDRLKPIKSSGLASIDGQKILVNDRLIVVDPLPLPPSSLAAPASTSTNLSSANLKHSANDVKHSASEKKVIIETSETSETSPITSDDKMLQAILSAWNQTGKITSFRSKIGIRIGREILWRFEKHRENNLCANKSA